MSIADDNTSDIQNLKDDFEPHNLSKKICEAIKTQKDINIVIKEVVEDALKNDSNTQMLVKQLVQDSIKEEKWQSWKQNWKHIVGWLVTIIIAFLGGGYYK
jgi:hypothetical protein